MDAARISRRTLLATAVAGGTFLLLPHLAQADDSPAKAFEGSFGFNGGDKERKARDEAIEAVVAKMSFLSRGIARDRLQQATPIPEKVTFAISGKLLTVTSDGRSYTAPLDGKVVKVKGINGDDLDLHYEIAKGRIKQIFEGDERGWVNIYALLEGGKLKVDVRVHSSKLPKDVVYTLTYGRA